MNELKSEKKLQAPVLASTLIGGCACSRPASLFSRVNVG